MPLFQGYRINVQVLPEYGTFLYFIRNVRKLELSDISDQISRFLISDQISGFSGCPSSGVIMGPVLGHLLAVTDQGTV